MITPFLNRYHEVDDIDYLMGVELDLLTYVGNLSLILSRLCKYGG